MQCLLVPVPMSIIKIYLSGKNEGTSAQKKSKNDSALMRKV